MGGLMDLFFAPGSHFFQDSDSDEVDLPNAM
jgi:hypothetical protein